MQYEIGYRKKMVATKREVLIMQFICQINQDIREISTSTPILGVRQLNATIENATRLNRECNIQYGE